MGSEKVTSKWHALGVDLGGDISWPHAKKGGTKEGSGSCTRCTLRALQTQDPGFTRRFEPFR